MLIFDGDLGLGVGSEPWQGAVSASSRHLGIELVGQLEGQWEKFWGLVGGISEHYTLVTSTELLEGLLVVEALCDIGRLLLDSNQNVASLVIEALGRVVVSDILNGTSDNFLVVEAGLGGDFTEDHHHAGLGGSLAGNLGQRVLGQAGVENGIGDLIGDLVWVSLSYRLGLENI